MSSRDTSTKKTRSRRARFADGEDTKVLPSTGHGETTLEKGKTPSRQRALSSRRTPQKKSIRLARKATPFRRSGKSTGSKQAQQRNHRRDASSNISSEDAGSEPLHEDADFVPPPRLVGTVHRKSGERVYGRSLRPPLVHFDGSLQIASFFKTGSSREIRHEASEPLPATHSPIMSSLVAEFKRMDDSLLSFSSDLREGLESPSSSEVSSEASSHASASPIAQSGGTMNNESGHLPTSPAEKDKIAANNKSVVGHVSRQTTRDPSAEPLHCSDSSSDDEVEIAREEKSRAAPIAQDVSSPRGHLHGSVESADAFFSVPRQEEEHERPLEVAKTSPMIKIQGQGQVHEPLNRRAREDSEVTALLNVESDAELTLVSDSSSDASSGAARILSSEQSRKLSLAPPLGETKGDEKGIFSGDDDCVTGLESAKRDLLVKNNDNIPTYFKEEEKDFGQPVAPIDDTFDFTFRQQLEEKEEEGEESECHDARERLLHKQSSPEVHGKAEVHKSSSDVNITSFLNDDDSILDLNDEMALKAINVVHTDRADRVAQDELEYENNASNEKPSKPRTEDSSCAGSRNAKVTSRACAEDALHFLFTKASRRMSRKRGLSRASYSNARKRRIDASKPCSLQGLRVIYRRT